MGFLSDIGSAATGAAGGFASGGPVGAAIGGGLGLLGSIFGGSGTNQQSAAASKAVLGNIPTLVANGNQATNTSLNNLSTASNFYNTILGGNREAISNLLGPEISTSLSQYDNAAKALQQFGGRGGGTTSQLANLPFAKAATAGSAFQSVLPAAASGLTSVGSAAGQLGSSLNATAAGQEGALLHQGQFDTEQAAKAGAGYGKILANGFGNILKKLKLPGSGGGGSASTPSTFGGDTGSGATGGAFDGSF